MAHRFETINSIEVYETNGIEEKGLSYSRPKLKVREHWNTREFVIIEINGNAVTVLAAELKRAIDNAQNAHRL